MITDNKIDKDRIKIMTSLWKKIENLPNWLQGIVKTMIKFIGFMLLWMVIASGFDWFIKPNQHKPTDYFTICVMENNQPNVLILTERNSLPLCQQDIEQTNLKGFLYIELQQVQISDEAKTDLTEWHLRTWNDSMGDPVVYHYQVQDDKVIPMWQLYGGMMTTVSNWFLGLIVSTMIWQIGKRLIKFKTSQIKPSEVERD